VTGSESPDATAGRTAIVTGAGSGLGRAIACALLDAGWQVGLAGRREEPLRQTADPQRGAGGAALVVPTDVREPASVEALFGAVVARWGRLDLLVNNAGVFGPDGPAGDLSPDGWQAIVAVNLTGAFLCARAAVRQMKAQDPQGGRIINNGSISAHSPRPGSVGYTATKHAITGLTKSLSLDGRAYRIACGQIDIGNAATELTKSIGSGARQADGSVRPEPTFDPGHVGDAVLYMASLPLDTNVQFLTITATAMPFIGRG
jgi:NAD(P)-dependent dehydrogenase (short-subunit alcohol dehydrogenase family)